MRRFEHKNLSFSEAIGMLSLLYGLIAAHSTSAFEYQPIIVETGGRLSVPKKAVYSAIGASSLGISAMAISLDLRASKSQIAAATVAGTIIGGILTYPRKYVLGPSYEKAAFLLFGIAAGATIGWFGGGVIGYYGVDKPLGNIEFPLFGFLFAYTGAVVVGGAGGHTGLKISKNF